MDVRPPQPSARGALHIRMPAYLKSKLEFENLGCLKKIKY
jgi:hypothetical protein